MLMRMVASFASSLSRSKNVLAAPPAHYCRLQPVLRIRYRPVTWHTLQPSAACHVPCTETYPVSRGCNLQALQPTLQVYHGRTCAPSLSQRFS